MVSFSIDDLIIKSRYPTVARRIFFIASGLDQRRSQILLFQILLFLPVQQ